MPVCPTCLGSGEVCPCARGEVTPHPIDISHAAIWFTEDGPRHVTCPTCSGRGWVLDEEALEKAAAAAANRDEDAWTRSTDESKRQYRTKARRAVLAYLEHKEE